jgi:antitoxin (DNA-binding transcriptional repressor) of toxin-antitoxin stability system
MTEFMDIRDADLGVIELISQVEGGKNFFITRGRKPVALIIKFEGNSLEEFTQLKCGEANGSGAEWADCQPEQADDEIRASWDAERDWRCEE